MSSPLPSILEIAQQAVHGRGFQHGKISDISRHISLLWDALDQVIDEAPARDLILDSGARVSLYQELLKLVRFCHQPRNRDHAADGAGYWELADRCVQDYLEENGDGQTAPATPAPTGPTDFAREVPFPRPQQGPTVRDVLDHEAKTRLALAAGQPAPEEPAILSGVSDVRQRDGETQPWQGVAYRPAVRVISSVRSPLKVVQDLSEEIVQLDRSSEVTTALLHLADNSLLIRVQGLKEAQALQGDFTQLMGGLLAAAQGVALPQADDALKVAREAAEGFERAVRSRARKTSHEVAAFKFTTLQMREAHWALPSTGLEGELQASLRDFFAFPFPEAQPALEVAVEAQEQAAVEEKRLEVLGVDWAKEGSDHTAMTRLLVGPGIRPVSTETVNTTLKTFAGALKLPDTPAPKPAVKLDLSNVSVERNFTWKEPELGRDHMRLGVSQAWQATLKGGYAGLPVVGCGATPLQASKALSRALQETVEFVALHTEPADVPDIDSRPAPTVEKASGPSAWQEPCRVGAGDQWGMAVWPAPSTQVLSWTTLSPGQVAAFKTPLVGGDHATEGGMP